jgi:histone acetyltransferase (RNA polymerase elongator complex component)
MWTCKAVRGADLDLADAAFQRRGIGRDLIAETWRTAPRAKIVLLSAPAAVDYYAHVGFTRHQSVWVLDPLAP